VNYPTAADLRAAANEAVLKRCDDPLLGEIMASAASAAAEGKTSCRIVLDLPIDDPRKDKIDAVIVTLGLQGYWAPTMVGGANCLHLSWD
jgi:hypothetical protein